jgi:hypothetical protein
MDLVVHAITLALSIILLLSPLAHLLRAGAFVAGMLLRLHDLFALHLLPRFSLFRAADVGFLAFIFNIAISTLPSTLPTSSSSTASQAHAVGLLLIHLISLPAILSLNLAHMHHCLRCHIIIAVVIFVIVVIVVISVIFVICVIVTSNSS